MAASLARDWIDQPAVARRAELQRRLSEVISSRQPSGLPPLGPVVLHQLMERHRALTRSLTASEVALQTVTQQLRQAKARRAERAEARRGGGNLASERPRRASPSSTGRSGDAGIEPNWTPLLDGQSSPELHRDRSKRVGRARRAPTCA